MNLSSVLRRNQYPTTAARAKTFVERVMFLAELFELDWPIPELERLVSGAEIIVAERNNDELTELLRQLNPHVYMRTAADGKTPELAERMFGWVLEPSTIARRMTRMHEDSITSIVADGSGTHLFDGERKIFSCAGGTINPWRRTDQFNRYSIALKLIKDFSGLDIDINDHYGRSSEIVAIRMNGYWIATSTKKNSS